MKRSLKELLGYDIATTDNEKGNIHDFLFDRDTWIIRYVETDFGNLYKSNRVIIPRLLFKDSELVNKKFFLDLTKSQIEKCPKPEDDQTVSRKYEEELNRHYNLNNYWMETYIMPGAGIVGPYPMRAPAMAIDEKNLNTSLHSFNEVKGYSISAIDDNLGEIDDLITDDSSWHIVYAIVDTRKWMPWSKKVILPVGLLEDISYAKREAKINLHTDTIKHAPEYDASKPVDMQHENALSDFYEKSYVK
jgi:hypothetical protein